MAELGIGSPARFCTSDMKYAPARFADDSSALSELPEEHGFVP